MNSTQFTLFSLAILLNSTANILMKASAHSGSIINILFLAGLGSFGGALIFYKSLLKTGLKLSVAYPLMTISVMVIVLFVSKFWFNEHLSTKQLAGVVMMVAGIALVSNF